MSDLISREAAIEAALTFLVEYCGAAFDEDMQKMLCDRLDALPSAQPERPKGEWVECVSSEHWKCNQCGDRAPMYWDDANMSYAEWLSPYCPNCGADMRGKEQDG